MTTSNSNQQSAIRLAVLSAGLTLLSACTDPASVTLLPVPDTADESSAAPGLGLQIPRVIVETRNVNLDQLRPTVTLSDGRSIPMTSNGTEWVGSIEVAVNSQQQINISWIELFDGRDLPLAELTKLVGVGDMAFALSIGRSEYITTVDSDGDGTSNLDERNALTNPFDGNSGGGGGPNPNTRVSVIVPRIDPSNAPVIDGLGAAYDPTELRLVGEWADAAQQGAFSGSDLFIDSLMIDRGNINVESNPFHRWAAAHDGSHLYLLVLVDDIGQHQSDSSEMHEDDSIEVFTDGNNSKLETYADSDDRYFTLPLQEFNSPAANISGQGNSRIAQGFQTAPLPASIEFATGVGTGPLSLRSPSARQDVYEIKVPLAELGITVGSPFGIEIQINDDDDGGPRDAKWGWIHPTRSDSDTDLTWQNPSYMGTAELAN